MGLDQLIQMAEENEFGGGSSATVINHAIRSRLDALKNTHIFARSASEAASLGKAYRQVRAGGALVIDMSSLSNLAREGFRTGNHRAGQRPVPVGDRARHPSFPFYLFRGGAPVRLAP